MTAGATRKTKTSRTPALPTETVYGLGADAENDRAVQRVFAAKGRPADHPLIVHLAEASQIGDWASDIPQVAHHLAARFWPGPLTLVLRGTPPGLEAIAREGWTGVRCPAHPAASAVLAAASS